MNDTYRYKYIDVNGATQVKDGPGSLHAIVVGTTSGGALSIIDGTTGNTANVATLKASIAEGTYLFDVYFKTGLRIFAPVASKITVIYR